MTRPLVYIAGPISSNPMHGTHNAVKVARRMMQETAALPFVPHLTVLWDMIDPHDYEHWMSYDFAMLEHCDAVYRMHGRSEGADREVAHADKLGLRIFHASPVDMRMIREWIACGFPYRHGPRRG